LESFGFSYESHLPAPLIAHAQTEYPENVASLLNPYFKKPLGVFHVLQIRFRNPFQFFYQLKSPDNFVLYFVALLDKKMPKIVFIKNDGSEFFLYHHNANITNVARK
jgi:hypothetical protein